MAHLSASAEIAARPRKLVYLGPEIGEYAAALRARAEQRKPRFSTREIIDACFPGTLVTGAPLPSGVHEIVSRRPEGTTIVYSRSLSGPAQRMAIAHALAHVTWDLDDPDAWVTPERTGTPEIESRADYFAAELLAPLREVEPFVRLWPSRDPERHEIYLDLVDEIASRFVVPASTIDLQIRTLALIHRIVSHD